VNQKTLAVDANKLICEMCKALKQRAYYIRYGVDCNRIDNYLCKYYNYHWALTLGCNLSRDLQCTISDLVKNVTINDPITTIIRPCTISVSDSTPSFSCNTITVTTIS